MTSREGLKVPAQIRRLRPCDLRRYRRGDLRSGADGRAHERRSLAPGPSPAGRRGISAAPATRCGAKGETFRPCPARGRDALGLRSETAIWIRVEQTGAACPYTGRTVPSFLSYRAGEPKRWRAAFVIRGMRNKDVRSEGGFIGNDHPPSFPGRAKREPGILEIFRVHAKTRVPE